VIAQVVIGAQGLPAAGEVCAELGDRRTGIVSVIQQRNDLSRSIAEDEQQPARTIQR
jgi:hypothetical protein